MFPPRSARTAAVLAGILALPALFAVAGGIAADEKSDKPPKLDGKELFKTGCKSCHLADSPHGEYTPMALIVEQWERFFDEKYLENHAELADSTQGGKKLGELLTPEMLKEIRKFCVEHAADSEHPVTCG